MDQQKQREKKRPRWWIRKEFRKAMYYWERKENINKYLMNPLLKYIQDHPSLNSTFFVWKLLLSMLSINEFYPNVCDWWMISMSLTLIFMSAGSCLEFDTEMNVVEMRFSNKYGKKKTRDVSAWARTSLSVSFLSTRTLAPSYCVKKQTDMDFLIDHSNKENYLPSLTVHREDGTACLSEERV